jgi:DNA-binding NarL/FixJ family response regulator
VVRVPDGVQSDEDALEQARLSWKLTRRQAEVLALLAQGQSNRLIASALTCSERTVELHIASLFKKAGCESRTALVAKFWRTRR